MLERISSVNYRSKNQHRKSVSKALYRSRSKSVRFGSWILDERNSTSGSRIYRKNVNKSIIALLPESRETFIENKTIIDKLARFLLSFAD